MSDSPNPASEESGGFAAAAGGEPSRFSSEVYNRRFRVVEIRVPDEPVRLMPTGDLDIAAAPTLEEAWRSAMTGRETLVIDLGELDFIDSSGLRALLHAQESCQADGCQVTLRPGSERIQRVFETAGLRDRFSWTR